MVRFRFFIQTNMREKAYRAICCSSSCILARLETFFGFGFGMEGKGVESFCKNISKVVFLIVPSILNSAYPVEPI